MQLLLLLLLRLLQAMDAYIKRHLRGDEEVDAVVVKDAVLEAGVDNFGFEHVQL